MPERPFRHAASGPMIRLPLQQTRPGPSLKAALGMAAVSRDPFRFPVEPSPGGDAEIRGTTADFVDAFAEIFGARVENFGADPLTWVVTPAHTEPDRQEFHFQIDAPGSTVELLALLLPGLLTRDVSTQLVLEGCTHAPGAYLPEQVAPTLAPLAEDVGGTLEFELESYGFPPRGGGRIHARVEPPDGGLHEVRWGDRGYVHELDISVVLAHLQPHIGEREIDAFADHMRTEIPLNATLTELHAAASQGNVMSVEIHGSQGVETLALLGEKGIRAEAIGRRCLSNFATYLGGRGRFHASTRFATLLAAAAGGDQVWTTGLCETTAAICELAPEFLRTHVEIQGEESPTTKLNLYRTG